MSKTITLEHVKASKLAPDLLKQAGLCPDDNLKITIEREQNEEDNYPSEEMIKEAFVEEMERRRNQWKEKKGTLCKTKKESDAFFTKVWGDE
ncbi:MAG: hypothetical protein ACUZ8E_09380 [Candidatus Anammoxibacter sp.]